MLKVYEVFAGKREEAYGTTPPAPVPGVLEMFDALRRAGVRIALQTGYAKPVANSIMTGLGWALGETVDALVTSDTVAASGLRRTSSSMRWKPPGPGMCAAS